MKYLFFFVILGISISFSQLIPKIEIYESGNVRTITYFKNEDNKLIIVKTENYFTNGQLESSTNFKNNQKHGEYTSFWENGEMSSRGFFNDGKMDSIWKFWDSNGNIEGISNWRKDLKHGKWTAFYNSGQIKQESNFKEGNLEGFQFEYHQNGSKALQAEWANGKRCGTWRYWDKNGTLVIEEYYVTDNLVGKKTF